MLRTQTHEPSIHIQDIDDKSCVRLRLGERLCLRVTAMQNSIPPDLLIPTLTRQLSPSLANGPSWLVCVVSVRCPHNSDAIRTQQRRNCIGTKNDQAIKAMPHALITVTVQRKLATSTTVSSTVSTGGTPRIGQLRAIRQRRTTGRLRQVAEPSGSLANPALKNTIRQQCRTIITWPSAGASATVAHVTKPRVHTHMVLSGRGLTAFHSHTRN